MKRFQLPKFTQLLRLVEPGIWGLNFSNLTPEPVFLTVCFRRKEEELSGACVSEEGFFFFFFEGDRVDNREILCFLREGFFLALQLQIASACSDFSPLISFHVLFPPDFLCSALHCHQCPQITGSSGIHAGGAIRLHLPPPNTCSTGCEKRNRVKWGLLPQNLLRTSLWREDTQAPLHIQKFILQKSWAGQGYAKSRWVQTPCTSKAPVHQQDFPGVSKRRFPSP